MNKTLNLLSIFLYLTCIYICESGWVDPDTSTSDKFTTSYVDGRAYELVYSDEFNVEGRSFKDGDDPRWTAINKDDYTNFALHYYNDKLVKTSNGMLNISTIIEDVTFTVEALPGSSKQPTKMTKNFQSGKIIFCIMPL